MLLSGNTVLITGGSSGIGLALAEAFLRAGNRVVICGRHLQSLSAAKARLPALHIKTCDVADPDECDELAEWMAVHFPDLNVLVNNAGIQRDIDFSQGIDAFRGGENELRANLEGPILLCGLFVPQLRGKPGATIINVSSGLGFMPAATMPVYCATKAAMHAFTLALRQQLEPAGITVIEVIPPAVDTNLNPEGRARRGHFKPGVSAPEFATAVMTGLAAGEAAIAYGSSEDMLEASPAELERRARALNQSWGT